MTLYGYPRDIPPTAHDGVDLNAAEVATVGASASARVPRQRDESSPSDPAPFEGWPSDLGASDDSPSHDSPSHGWPSSDSPPESDLGDLGRGTVAELLVPAEPAELADPPPFQVISRLPRSEPAEPALLGRPPLVPFAPPDPEPTPPPAPASLAFAPSTAGTPTPAAADKTPALSHDETWGDLAKDVDSAPDVPPWDRKPLMIVIAGAVVLIVIGIFAGVLSSSYFRTGPDPAWHPGGNAHPTTSPAGTPTPAAPGTNSVR